MDLAAMNISIGADLTQLNAAIPKAITNLTSLGSATAKLNPVLDASAKNLAKITAATAGTAGGIKSIADASTKAADSVDSGLPKSFEDLNASFSKFTDAFAAKWDPIIADAERLAQPLDDATAKTAALQQQVNAFGGGVFAFKTEGLEELVTESTLAVTAINSIPTNKVVNFSISENTQTALASIQGLSTEIDDLGAGGSVSIAKLNTALSQLKEASLNSTNTNDIKQYDNAISLLSKDLTNVEGIASKAGSGLSNFAKSTTNSSYATRFAVQDISNVFRDLPFALNNPAIATTSIDHVVGALNILKGQTGSFKGAMAAIGESLTGFGGVMVAVNLVGAAIGLFGSKLFSGSKVAEEAAKANEDYAKSLKDIDTSAIKDAEKSITSITALTNIVKDNTISLNERIDAAGKLQEQSGYFAALSKEQILYGNITDAINQTTQALLNKAFADAASSKAAEAGAKIYDIDQKRKQALTELISAQTAFNQAQEKGNVVVSTNIQAGGGSTAENPFQDQLNKAKKSFDELTVSLENAQFDQANFLADTQKYTKLSDNVDHAAIIIAKLANQIDTLNQKSIITGGDFSTDKINDYKKAVDDLLALPQTNETKKDIDDLIAKIKALGGSFDETASRAGKSKATIASVLADLNKQIASISDIEINLNENKSTEKINAILSTIKKLEDNFNVSPNDTIISKLFGEINDIQFGPLNFKDFVQKLEKSIPAVKPPAIPVDIQPVFNQEDFNDIVNRAQVDIESKKLSLNVDLSHISGNDLNTLLEPLQEIDQANQRLRDDFGVGLPSDVQKTFDAFSNIRNISEGFLDAEQSVNDFIGSLKSEVVIGFGQALGTALAGGNVSGLFNDLFKTLGEGFKELGKSLIETSPLLAALKIVFKPPFNPALALIAGVGFEILGTLIEAKAPKLGEGGIIPQGYPNDTFPAYLTSNEAVIPLDKLNQYINVDNNNQVLVPEIKVKGSDLYILLQRQEAKNKRTY